MKINRQFFIPKQLSRLIVNKTRCTKSLVSLHTSLFFFVVRLSDARKYLINFDCLSSRIGQRCTSFVNLLVRYRDSDTEPQINTFRASVHIFISSSRLGNECIKLLTSISIYFCWLSHVDLRSTNNYLT